jgi:hypothetical protein
VRSGFRPTRTWRHNRPAAFLVARRARPFSTSSADDFSPGRRIEVALNEPIGQYPVMQAFWIILGVLLVLALFGIFYSRRERRRSFDLGTISNQWIAHHGIRRDRVQ